MAFAFTLNNDISDGDRSVRLATWSGGATGDAGTAIELAEWADCCVQITGTIGGATVTIEGSNDGSNFATLNSAQGTALSFTSLTGALKQIVERPRYIRPNVTGGAASAIAVSLLLRRANPMRT